MITNLKHIKNKLENKGVKATHQRLIIMEYLINNKIHLTADMLFDKIVKQIPTLSKTTVYNTLNKFAEKKLVKVLPFIGNEKRFDSELSEHHHFICKKCGEVYDVKAPDPIVLDKQQSIDGNKIEEICGYYKGTCKNCIDKNQKKGANYAKY